MKRTAWVGAFIAAVLMMAPAAASAAISADDPEPGSTGSPAVSVTIPGPTTSPSLSPSPRPSSTSPGGGSTGGGSTPTPTPTSPFCANIDVDVDVDGVPVLPDIPASPIEDAGPAEIDPTTASAGSRVAVQAAGFSGGETVEATIYPEGRSIGSFEAESDGTFDSQLKIPAETSVGDHTIQLLGWTSCAAATGDIFVVSMAGDGSSIFPWIVWLIVGSGVVLAIILAIAAWLLGRLPWTRRGGAGG